MDSKNSILSHEQMQQAVENLRNIAMQFNGAFRAVHNFPIYDAWFPQKPKVRAGKIISGGDRVRIRR